jgi:hypothetical protein
MDDHRKWRPSRYGTLVLVAAFHIVLIALLIASSQSLRLPLPAIPSIEVALLPPNTAQRIQSDLPKAHAFDKTQMSPATDTSIAMVSRLVPALGSSGIPIDWADEARTTAAAMVTQADSRPMALGFDSVPLPKSAFPDSGAHHAGDQHRLDSGEWIVFISDNCYQISRSLPLISNPAIDGMGVQTFCLSQSRTPRGNLLDQLAAYKGDQAP